MIRAHLRSPHLPGRDHAKTTSPRLSHSSFHMCIHDIIMFEMYAHFVGGWHALAFDRASFEDERCARCRCVTMDVDERLMDLHLP